MAYLRRVLQYVLQEAGYTLENTSWVQDPEIRTLTMLGMRSIDRLYFWNFPNLGNFWGYINWYAPELDLRNHVPDIPALTFLQGIMRAFGLVPMPDENNHLRLLTRNEILANQEERDFRENVMAYQWERGEKTGHVFRSQLDEHDELLAGDYPRDEEDFTVAERWIIMPTSPTIPAFSRRISTM